MVLTLGVWSSVLEVSLLQKSAVIGVKTISILTQLGQLQVRFGGIFVYMGGLEVPDHFRCGWLVKQHWNVSSCYSQDGLQYPVVHASSGVLLLGPPLSTCWSPLILRYSWPCVLFYYSPVPLTFKMLEIHLKLETSSYLPPSHAMFYSSYMPNPKVISRTHHYAMCTCFRHAAFPRSVLRTPSLCLHVLLSIGITQHH